jgi:hypothetical protein
VESQKYPRRRAPQLESISSFTLTPANGARKKKTAIDRYGRANRPDHSKKWDQSLWAYRWWGRSLSHTRHQPRWADDEDRRFEVGPEACTVPSGRAQPVGGLALSSPARCAFGLRDSRRCIFGDFWIGGWIAKSRNIARVPSYLKDTLPITWSLFS